MYLIAYFKIFKIYTLMLYLHEYLHMYPQIQFNHRKYKKKYKLNIIYIMNLMSN